MTEFIPTYRWRLSDLDKVQKNGLKVFSTFACGGGSTMGYKLAGMDVIGANDIDPEMAWHYKLNHNPKHYFLEPIQTLKKRADIPKELFDLDILDGSPPCSSFSTSGSREKTWGKNKKFREGQAEQVLDDLFFHFIELAQRLQPKVVIAENVKGMLIGKAKGYVKQVINLMNVAGYDVQLFLLNAATMGVPQKRERVFFVCRRKDLALPELRLAFRAPVIPLRVALDGLSKNGQDRSSSMHLNLWEKCLPGNNFKSVHPTDGAFNLAKLNPNDASRTLTASPGNVFHWEKMRLLSTEEACAIGSYPLDYKFKSYKIGLYMIGMSVPPLMTYGIADQIRKQWFKGFTGDAAMLDSNNAGIV